MPPDAKKQQALQGESGRLGLLSRCFQSVPNRTDTERQVLRDCPVTRVLEKGVAVLTSCPSCYSQRIHRSRRKGLLESPRCCSCDHFVATCAIIAFFRWSFRANPEVSQTLTKLHQSEAKRSFLSRARHQRVEPANNLLGALVKDDVFAGPPRL